MMTYQKNDIVTVEIKDIGHDGAGIGKSNGYTVFIKDAIIGDVVAARIMKVKTNYAYAKLEKVLTPSSFRVKPECDHHRRCGGCQLQALSYDKQLEYKQNKVRGGLIRLGGFRPEQVDTALEPLVGMETPLRYRNKAQYPFGYDKEGKLITGFYAGRTHDIIANTDCLLGDKRNKEILKTILSYMKKKQITAYDEKTGTGLVRHVLIRNGFYTGEVMVCLVLNMKAAPQASDCFLAEQEVLSAALGEIPGLTGICVSLNDSRTNVIMGKEIYNIWGRDAISDRLQIRDPANDFCPTGQSFSFQISPLSFYQVNPPQAERLYSLALDYAGLTGRETVWDLYCGIGTISLFMAAKAKQVYGVDTVPEAIRDARKNAKRNQIGNVEFFSGKAEKLLPEKFAAAGIHADVVVVDPPRKGCADECLQTIIKMRPERIVYISCDSATLARDLRVLGAGGYELKRARAVDQFGQTVHVETVVLMAKVSVSEYG